jgi:tetratricopeptide (TPR) repeat protein
MNSDENQGIPTPDSLSPTQAEELDRACDRFEAEWRNGARPNIEDYLDTPRAHRSALLGELIVIDLHWRRRRGEQPTLDEYVARFGRYQAAVAVAFGRIHANALTTCEPDLGQAPVERGAGWHGTDSTATVAAGGPRFRIIREHARGGLGEVFVAVDTEVNREVALKEIRPEYANHPESRARFLIEAEVTGRLEHPLSNSLSYLGALYSRSSRATDAQNAHQKAISLFERLVDEHPEVADNQQGLAMALGNLANFLARSGRPGSAEKYHRRALHMFDAIAAKEPGRLNNQDAIAMTWFYIGDDLRLQGSYLEAMKAYDQAALSYESMRKNSPRYQPALDFLSETYRRRAEIHLMLGRTGPAITDLDRVDRMAAPRTPDLQARAIRALALAQSGDCERAVTLLPAPRGPNGAEIAFTGALVHAVASRRRSQATDHHASEAIRLLAIAHQLGFFQFQQARELLGRDSRFDRLRSRDDYQALVTDIVFPAQPFAP